MNKRKIDQVASKSYAKLGKKFSLVNRLKLVRLRSWILVAFAFGSIVAVAFGYDTGQYSNSSASEDLSPTTLTDNSCVASPAGGYFISQKEITITCGKNITQASYTWATNVTTVPNTITNNFISGTTKTTTTTFDATANKSLVIKAVYPLTGIMQFWGNFFGNKTFIKTLVYPFYSSGQPAPTQNETCAPLPDDKYKPYVPDADDYDGAISKKSFILVYESNYDKNKKAEEINRWIQSVSIIPVGSKTAPITLTNGGSYTPIENGFCNIGQDQFWWITMPGLELVKKHIRDDNSLPLKVYIPPVDPVVTVSDIKTTSAKISWWQDINRPDLIGGFKNIALRVGTDQQAVEWGCPNGTGPGTGCLIKEGAYIENNTVRQGSTSSPRTLSNLTPNTKYYYRVSMIGGPEFPKMYSDGTNGSFTTLSDPTSTCLPKPADQYKPMIPDAYQLDGAVSKHSFVVVAQSNYNKDLEAIAGGWLNSENLAGRLKLTNTGGYTPRSYADTGWVYDCPSGQAQDQYWWVDINYLNKVREFARDKSSWLKIYAPPIDPVVTVSGITSSSARINWWDENNWPQATLDFKNIAFRLGTDQQAVEWGCPNGTGGNTGCLIKEGAYIQNGVVYQSATKGPRTVTGLQPNTTYYYRVSLVAGPGFPSMYSPGTNGNFKTLAQ